MLHALALTATLLVLFLSFGQMARDILRYVVQAPKALPEPTEVVVVRWVRAEGPQFNPAVVPARQMRPLPLAA